MRLRWRPLSLDDMEDVAGLYAVTEVVEPVGERYSVGELRDEFCEPGVDMAVATTSAWDGDRLVAWGRVDRRDATEPVLAVKVDSVVAPGYRTGELGQRLIEWYAEAGREAHPRAFELHASARENQHWYTALLEAAGYAHRRTFVEMRAELTKRQPAQPVPDGLALTPYDDAYDELTRRACNDAFARHGGTTAWEPESWRHLVTGAKDFRGDLSFLALSPSSDEVLAFVLTSFTAAEAAAAEQTGVRELCVDFLGTQAVLRGKGVGTALLRHVMEQAHESGFTRVGLMVDVDNTHNALGIYERCGFQVSGRTAEYVRAF